MRTNQIVVLVTGVVLLAGLFFLLKPNQNKSRIQTQGNQSSPSAQLESSRSADALTGAKTFDLVVKDNKLVSGPTTLTVTEGDNVTIRITADVSGELHLHGYDKHTDFTKDNPSELKFQANLTGRFPYELEDTKTEIGALEVLPK